MDEIGEKRHAQDHPVSVRPRFQDQVAVVTGAAGGIGQAVCEALFGESAHVAAMDLCRSERLTDATWFECDISQAGAVRSAAEEIHQTLGVPDIVVHSAAATVFKDTLSTTPEDVAGMVLFLASDVASWITGGTHMVDGGATIARRWKE